MTTLAEREQAAADAQLMAVNDWLRCLEKGPITGIRAELTPSQLERLACELRAARRPKPPTQAERGLSVLDACGDNIGPANERELRTALLRLQELEQTATTTATTETTHD